VNPGFQTAQGVVHSPENDLVRALRM
jgi:hypothetical protein